MPLWRERVVTIDRFFVALLTVYVYFVLSTDYWNALLLLLWAESMVFQLNYALLRSKGEYSTLYTIWNIKHTSALCS